MSSEEHRATVTGTENFVTFGRVVFEICERTDIEIDRHTDRNRRGTTPRLRTDFEEAVVRKKLLLLLVTLANIRLPVKIYVDLELNDSQMVLF